MNAFSAILPTHAMFLEAASGSMESRPHPVPSPTSDLRPLTSSVHQPVPSESPRSVSSVPSVAPSDPVRKYVIVANPDGREHTILFSRDLQHSTMVPAGCKPVSAGFFFFSKSGATILANFPSESLNLAPRVQDQSAIKTFLS